MSGMLIDSFLFLDKQESEIDYTQCEQCENPLVACECVCMFCGKREQCDCALFDAATGG